MDKEAWDEEVKTTIYFCTGCGAEFKTSAELGKHVDDASDGKIDGHPNYGSMSSRVETTTVHHDEEFHYETVTKHGLQGMWTCERRLISLKDNTSFS